MKNCHDCNAEPGQPHMDGCDVEICSVCACQRLQCDCNAHDPAFARWSGWWPGSLEADALGLDMNQFYIQGYNEKIFIKPVINKYPITDWMDQVAAGNIKIGYDKWVEACIRNENNILTGKKE